MAIKFGTKAEGLTVPYLYVDNETASLSLGIDGTDSDKIKLSVQSSTGVNPLLIDQISIDPSANGNIILNPNGTGTVNIDYATQYALAVYGANGALSEVSGVGTAGQALVSNGAGMDPSWQSISATGALLTITGDTGGPISPTGAGDFGLVGGTTGLTFAGGSNAQTLGGTLVVSNGGTGRASHTAYAVICGGTTTTAAQQSIASVGSAGEVLTSNGAGALPTFQAAAGGGMTWTVITGTTQTLAASNGYFANHATNVTFSLPATAAVGDTYQVAAMHASGTWTIDQQTGQTMYIGNTNTTTTSGTLVSTDTGDWVEIVCRVANTDFQVTARQGNITVT